MGDVENTHFTPHPGPWVGGVLAGWGVVQVSKGPSLLVFITFGWRGGGGLVLFAIFFPLNAAAGVS